MFLKCLVFFVIIVTANNVHAQDKQQQKNLGKILNDQKLWQQSKMPGKTIYNGNTSYKVPMFPGQRYYQGEGITSHENKMVPKIDKTKTSFTVKFPANKSDSSNIQNKSFVRFK